MPELKNGSITGRAVRVGKYMGTGALTIATSRGEVKMWPGDHCLEMAYDRPSRPERGEGLNVKVKRAQIIVVPEDLARALGIFLEETVEEEIARLRKEAKDFEAQGKKDEAKRKNDEADRLGGATTVPASLLTFPPPSPAAPSNTPTPPTPNNAPPPPAPQPQAIDAPRTSGVVPAQVGQQGRPGGVCQGPSFSPPAGSFQHAQTVAVGSLERTAGAKIHYTVDDSPVTTASPVYTASLTLTKTTTVRAMVVAPGMTASPEASALYTKLA